MKKVIIKMNKDELQKALKDLAMNTTQDEYMSFVSKILVEANDVKLQIAVEKVKKEYPEECERTRKAFEKVYDAFEKDRQQYAIGLKNKVDKLRKEYETLNKQNIPKPNKIFGE